MGKATKQFEDELGNYLELDDQRVLMSTNSCTAALNCACLLTGAGPGDEVIAPSFTYVAAHQARDEHGSDVAVGPGHQYPHVIPPVVASTGNPL